MSHRTLLAILAVVFAAAPAGASAATYTVSPSGQDTNPGSSSKPFRTITRAAEVAKAGDTVNVAAGRYEETVSLTSANTGATFRGVGPTRPMIDGGGVRARGFNNNGANGITIENFEIKGQTEAGIFTAGSNNTISKNVIHHVGSPSLRESEGVRVNRGAGNRVAGNTIHHIGPGAESRGIWLLESRDGIVEDNTVYLVRKDGMRDWKGLDNTLRRNRSFLNWVGISLNTTTGATVVDNMIYENTQGLQLKHLSYGTVLDYWNLLIGKWSNVTHNTVFRSTEASVWIAQSEAPLDFLNLSENAFSGAGTAFLRDAPSLRGLNVKVDANSYSDVGGKPRYLYKAGYSSDPGLLDWALVRSLLGWELNAPPADAGSRGVAVADPKYTPYKMTAVDSSSKGTYYTTNHLNKTADNIQDTYWLTATNSNEYVTFDFGQQRTFNVLQLSIFSDGDTRNPRNVRFEVSNDGSTWKTVYEGANTDTAGAAYYYDLAQAETARYLRYTMVDNFGGDYFVMSDLEAGLLASTEVPVGAEFTDVPLDPNVAPTATLTSSCYRLGCSFDGTGSTDTDGSIASYSWDFGDGTPAATGATPAHTYAQAGTYTVRLTVTDDRGGTNTSTRTVTVSSPAITLTARGYKVKAKQVVDLSWTGVLSSQVDVYRNGSRIATTENDGAHTDPIGKRGTFTYKVCEVGTSTCSPNVTVVL
jgi:PKD repeat protein